jgi:hypothetical protein
MEGIVDNVLTSGSRRRGAVFVVLMVCMLPWHVGPPNSLLIYSFYDERPCEFPGKFEGRSSVTHINQRTAKRGS